MAVVVLELDHEFQVGIARALVDAPQSALVAAVDPNGPQGYLAVADTYDEAIAYAQEHTSRGWQAVVWEVPSRRPGR